MSNCRFEDSIKFSDALISHSNNPSCVQSKGGIPSIQITKKKPIQKLLERYVLINKNSVEFTLPVITISEGNSCEPWQKKHARHKLQDKQIWHAMLTYKHLIKLPCTITFSRFSSRLLDSHDNLPMAFKHITDCVARELTGKKNGKGDNDPRLTWRYHQEKSKAKGIKILFEF